jgi:hypothetical protein
MVNCFGLSAVEMQGMGHWFTFYHQVQIKKIIPACWFATSPMSQIYNFSFFPDETDLGSQVFPYSQRERERERERWGRKRNGG